METAKGEVFAMEIFREAVFEPGPEYYRIVQLEIDRLFISKQTEYLAEKRQLYRRQTWVDEERHRYYHARLWRDQVRFLFGTIPISLGHAPILALSRLTYGETLERRAYWYTDEKLQAVTSIVPDPLDKASEAAELACQEKEFALGIHTPSSYQMYARIRRKNRYLCS
jgi:hypothetical protein